MPLALIGFVLFVIAAVLQLIGGHAVTEMWCIIIGGALACLAIGWPYSWLHRPA